jgi:ubiquitin-like-conjugating enzyme ATG3
MDVVRLINPNQFRSYFISEPHREKGDVSKARDYLPADKQYLVTRGVPCLRRATSLAYTDADEDAERLLSFGDLSSTGNEADEWVETHTGRPNAHDSAANPGTIDDIPDLDGTGGGADEITGAIGNLSVSGAQAGGASETPDIDDIPDMEEELEEGDDEATAVPVKQTNDIIDARYESCHIHVRIAVDQCILVKSRWLGVTCCRSEPMTL